jgi:hypothetical protein
MSEAHNQLFLCPHGLQLFIGILYWLETLEQLHCSFVGAPMQGASEGPDGTSDSAVEITHRRNCNSSSESWGIEVVFGIENKWYIQSFNNLWGHFIFSQVELHEILSNGILWGGVTVYPNTRVAEVIPIDECWAEKSYKSERNFNLIVLW